MSNEKGTALQFEKIVLEKLTQSPGEVRKLNTIYPCDTNATCTGEGCGISTGVTGAGAL